LEARQNYRSVRIILTCTFSFIDLPCIHADCVCVVGHHSFFLGSGHVSILSDTDCGFLNDLETTDRGLHNPFRCQCLLNLVPSAEFTTESLYSTRSLPGINVACDTITYLLVILLCYSMYLLYISSNTRLIEGRSSARCSQHLSMSAHISSEMGIVLVEFGRLGLSLRETLITTDPSLSSSQKGYFSVKIYCNGKGTVVSEEKCSVIHLQASTAKSVDVTRRSSATSGEE
jgi:hypothetical protein